MVIQKTRVTKTTRKGEATQARALDAAAKLFVLHGFEHTSMKMIVIESNVALGSITHGFGNKAGLAHALHARAMGRLVVAVEHALLGQPANVPFTVTAVIKACMGWSASHPDDAPLLRSLGDHAGPHEEIGIQAKLAPLLEAWSLPLIRQGRMSPLTPAQLYSAIIAPALTTAYEPAFVGAGHAAPAIDWESTLSAMALAAMKLAKSKVQTVKADPIEPVATTSPTNKLVESVPKDLFSFSESAAHRA